MQQPEKFDYDGTLVFNGIYKTSPAISDSELDRSVVDSLNTFERGKPGDKRSGFVDIDFDEYLDEYENLEEELHQVAADIAAKEYRQETYDQPDELVDSEGEPTSGWERSTKNSYLYWDDPDFAFIQGSQGKVSNLVKSLRENWGGDVQLKPFEFDTEFLMYLVNQYDRGRTINGVFIESLNDAALSGTISAHGEENEVRGSDDITKGLPVIEGILLNYDFQELEGTFSFHGYEITANIRTQQPQYNTGRVHIKVEDDIENNTKLVRALLSLFFMQRLIDLYNEWKDMIPKDKYVHPEWFAELHRRAANLPESAELDFPLRELVTEYADLREEDADEYDLIWGSHEHGN
ncbi:hypothetical protein [Haloarchaeobius sp. DFWS5]|uniref:hypothetical protein n=1 Tax=Haloarchaeobius sp. DFWS5 TaxID=3446114 RepID=UPI003EBDC30C